MRASRCPLPRAPDDESRMKVPRDRVTWPTKRQWQMAWVPALEPGMGVISLWKREREREIKGILTASHQAHGRQLCASRGIRTCELNTERNRWAMESQSALEHQFGHACVVVVFIVINSHAHSSSLFCRTNNAPMAWFWVRRCYFVIDVCVRSNIGQFNQLEMNCRTEINIHDHHPLEMTIETVMRCVKCIYITKTNFELINTISRMCSC